MLHNQRVNEAVSALLKRLSSAHTESELLSIVQTIAAAREDSLQYKDLGWKVISGVIAVMGLVVFLFAFGFDFLHYAYFIIDPIIFYAHCWLPVVIVTAIVLWREEAGKPFRLMSFIADSAWRVAALAAILFILLYSLQPWATAFWNAIFWVNDLLFPATGVGATVGIIMLLAGGYTFFKVWHRSSWRSRMSNEIQFRDTVLDSGLSEIKEDKFPSAKELVQDFREFKRGNDTRNMEKMYSGDYFEAGVSFPYQVYQYHYVVRRTVTTTDSKGRMTTRTVYDNHYRYGILLSFPQLRNVCFSSDSDVSGSGRRLKDNLHGLDDYYLVYTNHAEDLQRFMTPERARLLSEFARNTKDVVFEVNDRSRLCIAFSQDIFATSHQYSLENPKEFAREVAGDSSFPHLQRALTLVHKLL